MGPRIGKADVALVLGGKMELLLLLLVAPHSLLLLSCSWPETDCTLIPESFLLNENLPASSESPLSSAVVAKPKDRDDRGRRADLLMEKDDDW